MKDNKIGSLSVDIKVNNNLDKIEEQVDRILNKVERLELKINNISDGNKNKIIEEIKDSVKKEIEGCNHFQGR